MDFHHFHSFVFDSGCRETRVNLPLQNLVKTSLHQVLQVWSLIRAGDQMDLYRCDKKFGE